MALARILPDPYQTVPFVAEAAIGEGYVVVGGTAVNACALAGATPTSNVLGITRTSVANGAVVDVVMGGIARAIVGAAVAKGVPVTSDAAGKVVTAAPGGGTNNMLVGWALEAATGADQYIAVKVALSMMQG